MNLSPASSIAARFASDSMPGVGDHGHLRQLVRGRERLHHRQDGLGLGLVALERVHHQREPARVGQQPDGDLRLQPAFLGEPGLAEPVALIGLEVQRVGSARGAVTALPLFRFPGPPAEPAVRLSTQRALHEGDAAQLVVIGS